MKKLIDFCQRELAWVLLIIVCIIFGMTTPNFFSLGNIFNVLNQYAYLIIATCGVALIMIGGEMDMSIGYHMGICNILCAMMLTRTNLPIWLVIVITLALSIGLGLFATFLQNLLGIPRIFVSIGLSTLYQGVAFVLSNSKTISGFPDAFKVLAQGTFFPNATNGLQNLTYATVIMIVFVCVMSFVLSRTYFGRHIFAMGGNQDAARLAGIDVKKMQYIVGALVGFFVGFSGIILMGRVGAAAAGTAAGTEINIMTGILLGGVSIRGGEGKLGNCVAGILLIGLIGNGMQLLGWNPYYQYIAKGAIMLCVMGFDRYQLHKRTLANTQRKEENTAAPAKK